MAGQGFPYDVSYGMSRLFRVRHMNVGSFHIEQLVQSGPKPDDTAWKLLAISNHFDPSEALRVMHEAQIAYITKVRRRKHAIGRLSNGLDA